MGGITDYAAHKLLEHLVAKTAYTPPATIYAGLCTANPTDAATGASCHETANAYGYARTAITFAAATNRIAYNSALVRFPNATGTYASPITHWMIADSATYGAGNVLAYGAFTSSLSPVNGKYVRIPASACGIGISNESGNGLSITRCNNLLDLMFRNTAFSVAAVYARLASNVVTELGSFTEITGSGYGPVAATNWSTATSREIHNSSTITFGPPTGTWVQAVSGVLSLSSTVLTDVLCFDESGFVDFIALNADTVSIASSAFSIAIAGTLP